MAGFQYVTSAATGTDKFRHYMAMMKGRSFAGAFTLQNGVTGSLPITGLGFQPQAVFIFGTATIGFGFLDVGLLHWGYAAGSDQWAGSVFLPYLADGRCSTWEDDQVLSIVQGGGGLVAEASLDSFDADGFTLDVTTAPGYDATIGFIAFRGGGGYHVGTDQAPVSTGTQAITGLGFEPKAIFFACAQRDTLGPACDHARPTFGGGDGGGQWNVWAGSKSGDVYVSQAAQAGAVLSLWEDADFVTPTQPNLLAEAELVSLDADGFTLDWTTVDGNAYYYSWFAVGGPSEVGRWVYNHAGTQIGNVATARRPRGLIFFMNDLGDDGSLPQIDSGGASISLGVCDQRANQFKGGYDDWDQPPFSNPQSDREMRNDIAFGAYARKIGGLPFGSLPNNEQDCGTVIMRGRDHLLRLHLGQ